MVVGPPLRSRHLNSYWMDYDGISPPPAPPPPQRMTLKDFDDREVETLDGWLFNVVQTFMSGWR